jgi:hypothetical protein
MGRRRPYTPIGFCKECGMTFRALTWNCTESDPYRQEYCSKACANRAREPKVKIDRHGYVYTYRPGSTKKQRTQVYAHRVVMEQKLGRQLTARETVHHKNGVRSDNRPENLELWSSRHGRGQRASDLEPDIWSGMIPAYLVNCRL